MSDSSIYLISKTFSAISEELNKVDQSVFFYNETQYTRGKTYGMFVYNRVK